MSDGDNDGLWTSIVLAAEALRHAVARAEGDSAVAEEEQPGARFDVLHGLVSREEVARMRALLEGAESEFGLAFDADPDR